MEDLTAPARRTPAQPLTGPNLLGPMPLADRGEGDNQELALSATLEASLRLAASLLAQCEDTEVFGAPVIDLDLGGFHWTVSRCVRVTPSTDPQLSPRELEIVRMVALGLTNRAIASALDISPWTVATHLRRVFGKLVVNSRAAMVAQAIELGLHPGTDGLPHGDSSV
jgi:DNA-binding CsgD family transcriptional regulator